MILQPADVHLLSVENGSLNGKKEWNHLLQNAASEGLGRMF
jgi:hypothetical protein